MIRIITADKNHFEILVKMGLKLWPDHNDRQLIKEFTDFLASSTKAAFLFQEDDGEYSGFATVSLRNDYVPGAKSSPTAYLEGLFVEEKYHQHGIAKQLVKKVENWAKTKGCRELASDTWDWNKDSQQFHQKLGFKPAETLVHFIKKI